jgi:hypothetical protein
MRGDELLQKSTGVGDTGSSFGFDGFRCRAWHDLKSSPYGQKWKAGGNTPPTPPPTIRTIFSH